MQTDNRVARQYATRPPDERYASLDALIAAGAEDRRLSAERTYNLRDLRLVATSPDGVYYTEHDGTTAPINEAGSLQLASPRGQASLTHWSFGQLCRTLGAPASYLRDLPPSIAADALNHGIAQAPSGTALTLLVKAPNGAPEPIIRAATSDSYGRVWDQELYSAFQTQLVRTGSEWAPPVAWNREDRPLWKSDRDSFVFVCDGGSIVTDPSVSLSGEGRMFRGLLVRNSEVGAAAVSIETGLFRAICGNFMLWGWTAASQFRRRHVGAKALRDTMREVSRIAWSWTTRAESTDQAIVQGLIDREIAHTKDAVLDELRSFGATKEQAESAYLTCEQQEAVSPRSYWGAAQGLTRIAQERPYQDERHALDRLAALVLARGAKLVKV